MEFGRAARIIVERELQASDIVEASTEQITHKIRRPVKAGN